VGIVKKMSVKTYNAEVISHQRLNLGTR
jgi:hypothetical protein